MEYKVKDNVSSFEECDIPKGTTKIYSMNRGLKSLKGLPPTVIEVWCAHNEISSFEHLPNSVKTIGCSYNQITSFEHLPEFVEKIWCWGNQITSFDYLPPSVRKLNCEGNPCYREYQILGSRIIHLRNMTCSEVWKIWQSHCQICQLPQSYIIFPPEEVINDILDLYCTSFYIDMKTHVA
jgi:hypothetical protein